MPIREPQAILQREAVLERCRQALACLSGSATEEDRRLAVQPVLTEALAIGTEVIQQRFAQNPGGTAAIKERSWLVDQIIGLAWQLGCECLSANRADIAIMAAGGYGRQELFFHSDVDVMVLVGEDTSSRKNGDRSNAEILSNFILYLLWDVGLQVGHSVRSVRQALQESKADHTVRTNLLEARYVCGDPPLAENFFRQFQSKIIRGTAPEFIQFKLDEWRARHEKLGESRYVLEPNVKEGKGGLRDLHTLMWLARYCFGVRRMRELFALGRISEEELKEYRRARKFLHIVRLHLHDLSGRPEERLTFDAQREIAARLQYRGQTPNQSVERFMKRYFLTTKTVGRLTRNFYFMLEEEYRRQWSFALPARLRLPEGFRLKSDCIHLRDEQVIHKNPVKILELFWLSHEHGRDIHPQAWQWVTRNLALIDRDLRQNAEANRLFARLLCDTRNPEAGLRRLNESGVLSKFIPDFGRIVGQMQFDLYHTYTVDEHTILALGILHRIELGEFAEQFPLATRIFPQVQQRRALYLGLLCHDIAKGRGDDHSELGEKIARRLGRRFGFDEAETETAAWLVKQHLLMSVTASKRDLGDPLTIAKFAEEVQSLQRLRLLLILTVADIRAVGPTIWNNWKGALLRDLYHKAERILGNTGYTTARPLEELEASLREQLPQCPEAQIRTYLEQAEPAFLEAHDARAHAALLPLWREVTEGKPFAVRFASEPAHHITEMTVAAPDRKGLFADIAGVMAVGGANIVHARIATRKDGVAIDQFGLQDMRGQAFDEKRRQERITERLHRMFNEEMALREQVREVEQRYPLVPKSFRVAPVVFIDNLASERHSVIEIQCLDRRGLLYEIADALTRLDLNIVSAHISTYGEVATDVFYVKDAYGMKLHNENRQEQVKEQLLRVLRRGKTKGKKAA